MYYVIEHQLIIFHNMNILWANQYNLLSWYMARFRVFSSHLFYIIYTIE